MRVAAVLSIAVLCSAGLAWSQEEEIATFRTSVSVVRVDAQVSGPDGRTVAGLGKSEFRVYDEDQVREIVDFQSETEPLHLLLLLDVSGSMSRTLGEMSARTTEALRQLREQDRVALMVFAERFELIQDWTPERDKIGERITNSVFKSQWGRGTVYNDALMAAIRQFDKVKAKGRRSIVIVSDGLGTRGSFGDAAVMKAAQDADVVVNLIQMGSAEGAAAARVRYTDPSNMLPSIAEYVRTTGGETASGQDAAEMLKRVVGRIATRYTMQYPAPSGQAGTFRKIRVELTPEARKRNPGATITARTGYYVDP